MFLVKADLELADQRLRTLRATPDVELGIDAEVIARAREAFEVPPEAAIEKFAHQGTFHRLYVARPPGRPPRLLRLAAFTGEPWVALMEMEAALAKALRHAGLPVPHCRFAPLPEGGTSRGAQLVELLHGEPANAADADEARMVANLAACSAFLARLHALPGTGFGPLSAEALAEGDRLQGTADSWAAFVTLRLEEHLAECLRMRTVTAAEAARVRTLFAPAALHFEGAPALLHGDPGGHNFILRDGRIEGVIDWEDALLGDPLFDLASMCTFQPPRRHPAILGSHAAVLVRGSPEWRRFWLYFLRISLAKTVHRHRFGYADAPGRPPASGRIQAALSELAASP